MQTQGIAAYYRVSTDGQEESGLGLGAQRAAVEGLAHRRVLPVTREFQDTESGRNADRAGLLRALAHCRRSGNKLVIAKMDRLTRELGTLLEIERSGVDFEACDLPGANKFTIRIMVAVAEQEAELISARTRQALAAFKAGNAVPRRLRDAYRGSEVPEEVAAPVRGRLGASLPQCRNLTPEARALGRARAAEARADAAEEAYRDLAPRMASWRAGGLTYAQVAGRLNAEGECLRSGKPWNAVQARRVLVRAARAGRPAAAAAG